jgi:ethanolamine utilization protein EutQ (cupin superfamily)
LCPQRAGEHRSFGTPDETRPFPTGRAEIIPFAGTNSCEAPHFQYHVSGQLAILMDDGTELVAGPGDLTSLPSGHDTWVVGSEPVVVIDWFGASEYAKRDA